jgi:hypothetical protein
VPECELSRNACLTTGTISGICCEVGVLYLWVVGPWAFRLRCGFKHAHNNLTQEPVSHPRDSPYYLRYDAK